MELNKLVKKQLLETKKLKNQILTEEKLVESRLMMIVESKENLKNFKFLPEHKKTKIALAIFEEINYLSQNKILNENLNEFLNKIFGNFFGSVVETLVEPIIGSLLGKIGIKGYFKNFLVSFITTHPTEFARALTDCNAMTKLIAESLSEAIVMMIQEKTEVTGQFANFIRNTLGGLVKDVSFVSKIENFIGDMVCSGLDMLSDKAENVYNKLKNSGLNP